jgi:hypothetical protein
VSSKETLGEGQRLEEVWRFEYVPLPLAYRGPERVRARMVWWPNSTHYATSVEARTIFEARLHMVLQLARAICDDTSAFQHDAEDIYRADTLRWFQSRRKELVEELEAENWSAKVSAKSARKLNRKLAFLDRLIAEWQEDHDYWPDEEKLEENEPPIKEIIKKAGRLARTIESAFTDDRRATRQVSGEESAPQSAPRGDGQEAS